MAYNAQKISNFFRRMTKGKAVGVANLYEDLQKVYNILENMEGTNGLVIHKPTTADGKGWIISGGNALPGNTPGVGMGSSYPRNFDIYSLSDVSIEIGGLFYLRGDIFVWQAGTISADLTGTMQYVAAYVDTVAGTISIAVSSTDSEVFPYSVSSDSQTYKIPLYQLVRTIISETETTGWQVLQDFRGCSVVMYA